MSTAIKSRFSLSPEEAMRRLNKGEVIKRLLADTMNLTGYPKILIEYKLIDGVTHARIMNAQGLRLWRESRLRVDDMLKSKWYGEEYLQDIGFTPFG